jgi:hypothetical protein
MTRRIVSMVTSPGWVAVARLGLGLGKLRAGIEKEIA